MDKQERAKLIADLEAGGLTARIWDGGITCNVYVPDYALAAFVKMVQALDNTEANK